MLKATSKQAIQQAYSKLLNEKQYRSRLGQRKMIAEIANYLGDIEADSEGVRKSDAKICAVEAGTGTGKTLAYCMATIPLAKEFGKTVVISTATTALQDQIVSKDLPDILKNSGLDFSWAIAKGRRRYLCLSKLDQLLHRESENPDETLPLFLLEQPLAISGNERVHKAMLQAFADRSWDGDKDSWPDPIESHDWLAVSTDNQQCANRRCSNFQYCAYFENRQRIDDADIIVANHDLVLADLSLGGGVVLPPPKDVIYIFDEGHHLPDKALNHFAVSAGLRNAQQWLRQLTKVFAELLPYISPSVGIRKRMEKLSEMTQPAHNHLDALFNAMRELAQNQEGDLFDDYRFAEGKIPDALKPPIEELRLLFASITRLLDELHTELTRALDEKPDASFDKEDAERWFPVTGTCLAKSESILELMHFYHSEDKPGHPPNARWVKYSKVDGELEVTLLGSPVLADSLLYHKLWTQSFAAIVTSATLTSLGNFKRIQDKSGYPEGSRFLVVESPFDYVNVSELYLPSMTSDPGNAAAHTEEIIEMLPELLSSEAGQLVLFSSRKQLNDVYDGLDSQVRDLIITQDEMSKQEVIKLHKQRIDDDSKSIIFGLASFAEGIDLPGKYLTQVVIAKIPFSVPDDPLEAGLAEWITSKGGNPFMQITVPDASTRLIQACGRLLRTESDYGRVTILDKRLITRRYGQQLLASLPPFRRLY